MLSPLAFVVANFIILWSGWTTDWKLGVLILVGCAVIFNREFPEGALKWKAAAWLPIYLIGMGLITYESTYGPGGHIQVWYDMVIVAIFSLGIYYTALAVSLKGDEIERMINEVVVPEEDEVAPVPLG